MDLGTGRACCKSDCGHALAAGGQAALAGQLASLLAGMGQELLAVLPEQAKGAREQLAAQLDEGRLRDVLQAHQVGAHCFTLVSHWCVRSLKVWRVCLPKCVGQSSRCAFASLCH